MSRRHGAPPPTVIVGYGHAGRDLHHAALVALFGPRHEVLAVEPAPVASRLAGAPRVASLADAFGTLEASGTSPADAVFHVTTPPASHLGCVEELVARGARRIIVEKPVASTPADARRIAELAGRAAILPVSVWLASRVTQVVEAAVAAGEIGTIRSLHMDQSKPRFERTGASAVHDSAFEVEMPHQLLLALALAGPFQTFLSVVSWPMVLPERTIPAMGGAVLKIRHEGGTTSTLVTDLTAPVRMRRLRLEGTHGEIVADYPVSRDDHHGQVRVSGRTSRVVVPDAPLSQFLQGAYDYFGGATTAPPRGDLALHVRCGELLDLASRRACHIPAFDMELAW